MTEHPRRKSDAARRANQVIRRRTMLVMLLLGVATFTALFWKLYDLQVLQHDDLKARAVSQQTDSSVISASRGDHLRQERRDHGHLLRHGDGVHRPLPIEQFVENQEKNIAEGGGKAAEKGEAYTPPPVRDQAYIAKGLARILEVG